MVSSTKYQAIIIPVICSAALLIIAAQFDGFAGNIAQTGALVASARFLSFLGNGATLIVLAGLLYLSGMGLRNTVFKGAGKETLYAIASGSIVVHLLKACFERARPSHADGAILELLHNPSLFDLTGSYNSFPSGHTTVSFAVAYVLARRFPQLKFLFYALAALVGLSRIYLGSHYPTDVAAGVITGLIVGYLVTGITDEPAKYAGRLKIAGFIFAVVFISFFKNGSYLLFDVDEAVFSEASREMAVTGDVITPTYNLEPRYDKPVLIYWFMASSMKLFGVHEYSARLTSALFGTLLVLMTFLFIKRARGELSAYLSAFALLLNLEFFVYTHSAVTDMTLGFFITASLFAFYLGVKEDDARWFAWGWGASALAVLTKGVIGLLFPSVIALLFLFAARETGKLKLALRPKYIGLFFLIAAPWFIAEFAVNGWEFFDAFIVKHHIKRYSSVISSHSGPAFYYIPVLILGFFPWVALLPSALTRGIKEIFRPGDGLSLLCMIWFFFVLAFFSAAKTKLPNYIFPLYPPMAVMAGLYAAELIERKGEVKPTGLFFLIMISVVAASALILLPSMNPQMDVALPPIFFYSAGVIFLATGLFGLYGYESPRLGLTGVAAMAFILLMFLRLYALPPVNIHLQQTLYEYSVYAASLRGQAAIATYELNKPSIAFYSKGKVIKVERGTTCDIDEYGKRGKLVIITTKDRLGELSGFKDLRVIDERGGYVLIGNTDDLPPLKRRLL